MAKRLVLLDYMFLFNPDEVGWDNVHDFEKDLVALLDEKGLDSQIIKSVEGQTGKRMILLMPKAKLQPLGVGDMPQGKKVK